MGFGAVLGQSRNTGGTPTTSTGKRTARFSIGTSTNGWTANDCDYLCDGTDDQVEINAAIQALPSGGGEIVILDGTYNINATISINIDNVTLRGNGNNTVLVRCFNNSDFNIGVISVTSTNGNCIISDLRINGSSNYVSSYNSGIVINSNNVFVSNIYIYDVYKNSINIGIDIIGNYNKIKNCYINYSTSYYGISIEGNDNKISNNTLISVGYGIRIQGDGSIVSNNFCENNSYYGINPSNVNKLLIVGNVIIDANRSGINCLQCHQSILSNNCIIKGTGNSSDYTSSQYSIYLNYCTSNLISSNLILGKNGIDNNGSGNTWVNNKYN